MILELVIGFIGPDITNSLALKLYEGEGEAKLKRGYMIVIGFLVLVAAVLLFLFRVSEGQVTVQRMIDFEQAEPTSQVVWKDRSSVSAFEYAFRFGKRLEGKVDIAAPPYQVSLGERRYWLWISDNDEQANFMKPSDTGTLYRLSMKSTKKLQELLKQAYSGRTTGSLAEGYPPDAPSFSPTHRAEELTSPFIESPTPMPEPSSSLPSAADYTPAYLDSASFSSEEQPLIDLINLRIKAVHEGDWEQFVSLYTEFKRKEYEASGSFNGMITTSIQVEGDISIKEQKTLYEAVVRVQESRNNGEGSAGMYVFHKGKQEGDEWRIADVD